MTQFTHCLLRIGERKGEREGAGIERTKKRKREIEREGERERERRRSRATEETHARKLPRSICQLVQRAEEFPCNP
jgi:hypothetical protein